VIQWALGNVFVWVVRLAVLTGACLSMKFILADQLGYRVEFPQMWIGGLLIIVTVRIWMPWTSPFSKETRSFDDVSPP
jgi:hypothetical protein